MTNDHSNDRIYWVRNKN